MNASVINMLEEHALVTRVQGDTAWVRTERDGTCGKCSVRSGCGTSLLQGIVRNSRFPELSINNTLHLGAGDRVVVGIQRQALNYAAALFYLLPLITLFVGAIVAEHLHAIGFITFSWATPSGGFIGLLFGFLIAYYFSRPQHLPRNMRVQLLRKV